MGDSGEVNIVLGLLKETRDDIKTMLGKQGEMHSSITLLRESTTAQFIAGERRMERLETEQSRLAKACRYRHGEPPSDYPPHPYVLPPKPEATTKKTRKSSIDMGLLIKIGIVIGAAISGAAMAWGAK